MDDGVNNNKWLNQRIKKKFMNRKGCPGGGKGKCCSCNYTAYQYRIDRVLNKRYLHKYCKYIKNRINEMYNAQFKYDDLVQIGETIKLNRNNNQQENTYNDDSEYIPKWQCIHCTFINLHSTPFCSACNKPFDYNHQNNQNNLHYDEAQPLIIQYKSKKNNNHKTIKNRKNNNYYLQATNTKKDILSTDENYMVEAEKYRLCKNNKKKQYLGQSKKECFELFDIEISVITVKCNEYEYIEDKLYDDLDGELFWMDIPIKLINTKLQKCSLKIIPKNKQNTKWIHFKPQITNFFIPIYMTKYLSIYKHDSIPKLLQNESLFKMIKQCLNQCSVRNITFNHNLSTISFNLYQYLFEYIPSNDILKNILFPFVGYHQALYIKTNVKNVNIKKNIFAFFSNDIDDKINVIDDNALYIKRKPPKKQILISIKNKKQSDDADHDDDGDHDDSIPLWFKSFYGSTDDETEDDDENDAGIPEIVDKKENIENAERNDTVLFKVPYKYCKDSYLTDDDPEREKKWWINVKYYKGTKNYKLNDRVKVLSTSWNYYTKWWPAKVIETANNGVKIKYDQDRYHVDKPEEFIYKNEYKSKLKLISTSSTCTVNKFYEKQRKAYSKSNTINYFRHNGR